jgi:hypothetical protein
MDQATAAQPLELANRIRRSQGRLPRICAISTRVASDELSELEGAAKREGKAIGEWSRDQLIAAARRPKDDIVLTELIGLRMFLVNILRPIALGEDYTDEQFRGLLDHVRAEKRSVTGQVMEQYRHNEKEQ